MFYPQNSKIITKKQHPCGSTEWQVIRTGADYKIKCMGCGHVVLLDALKLKKMVKQVIEKEGEGVE